MIEGFRALIYLVTERRCAETALNKTVIGMFANVMDQIREMLPINETEVDAERVSKSSWLLEII